MRFVEFAEVADRLRGKSVAVVGGAPSCLDNAPGFVDLHDVVVRVNNYRTGSAQGTRCDVFYSFFGGSIKKTPAELRADGVTLCMAKCPDAKPIESPWHEKMGKSAGVDFRGIYEARRHWWFCDTFIPEVPHFLRTFELLDGHIPTTGFAAILDVLACEPASVYLTGFDGFTTDLSYLYFHNRATGTLLRLPNNAAALPVYALRGTGIEVMATSDNVLRGGLTTKHIAVDELVKVGDFSWVEPEILSGTETAPGVWAYPTPCPEFDVWRLELVPGRTVTLPADTTARIALVTRGDAAFVEGDESMPAPQGSALFVAAGRNPRTACDSSSTCQAHNSTSKASAAAPIPTFDSSRPAVAPLTTTSVAANRPGRAAQRAQTHPSGVHGDHGNVQLAR